MNSWREAEGSDPRETVRQAFLEDLERFRTDHPLLAELGQSRWMLRGLDHSQVMLNQDFSERIQEAGRGREEARRQLEQVRYQCQRERWTPKGVAYLVLKGAHLPLANRLYPIDSLGRQVLQQDATLATLSNQRKEQLDKANRQRQELVTQISQASSALTSAEMDWAGGDETKVLYYAFYAGLTPYQVEEVFRRFSKQSSNPKATLQALRGKYLMMIPGQGGDQQTSTSKKKKVDFKRPSTDTHPDLPPSNETGIIEMRSVGIVKDAHYGGRLILLSESEISAFIHERSNSAASNDPRLEEDYRVMLDSLRRIVIPPNRSRIKKLEGWTITMNWQTHPVWRLDPNNRLGLPGQTFPRSSTHRVVYALAGKGKDQTIILHKLGFYQHDEFNRIYTSGKGANGRVQGHCILQN